MSDMRDHIIIGAFIVAILVVIASCNATAPCDLYRYATIRDIPARCIAYFTDTSR